MEKDVLRNRSTNNLRERSGEEAGLPRSISDPARQTTSSEFVLQWGNRKRLRCMKVPIRNGSSGPVHRTTVRVDRRVVRAEKDSSNQATTTTTTTTNHNNNGQISGYFNLRQRPVSPQAQPQPQPYQRILRNSENSGAMRGNGSRGFASPDRGVPDKRGSHNNNTNHHNHDSSNNNNRSAGSSETANDSKKGGSSSGSGEAAPPLVWPPKFVIALTNKEKEEDFWVLKGSKLPQRPKKRAKFIQRTLNLVSPGAWLCDLTLDRYEVREKKVSKKRPRGLKAMTTMESDSE